MTLEDEYRYLVVPIMVSWKWMNMILKYTYLKI